jgi:hypothetical protein
MKSVLKMALVTAVLLAGAETVFAGGGDRVGTAGAVQLQIPVGARGIALGGSNIAATSGIDALFWNPAGVPLTDNSVDVTFSHMEYIFDVGVEYGAVAAKAEDIGTFAFSIKSLSIGEIDKTTTLHPDGTGATFTPQFLTAGVTYARLLTDNISVGVTATYISETMDLVSADGMAFNVGILYRNLADMQGLNFGVAIKNLGPQMQYDGSGLIYQADVDDLNRPPQYYKAEAAAFELPSTFEIGLAYAPVFAEVNQVKVLANFQNNNFAEDEYRMGLEYGYDGMFFARGGYVLSPEDDNYAYSYSGGAGVKYDMGGSSVEVGYAYRHFEYYSGNHVFDITLGF